MEPTGFVDLDGVLVNFFQPALRVGGLEMPPREVRWCITCALGLGETGPKAEAYWQKLGFDFWANLPWHKEGRRLVAGLEQIFGPERLAILSSPVSTSGAVEGKIAWIRHNMPDYSRRFFIGPVKHMMAGPGKFLIDDNNENVDQFGEHGGVGILVPRPWNRLIDLTNANGGFDPEPLLQEVAAQVDAYRRGTEVR